jgi:hypothetical protein
MHGAQLSWGQFPARVLVREPKELLHPPAFRAAGVRAVRAEKAPAAVKVVDRAAVDRADKFHKSIMGIMLVQKMPGASEYT